MDNGRKTWGDRYVVDFNSPLGSGSFATVYPGRKSESGQEVAVKVPDMGRGLKAAEDEVRALLKLTSKEKHPNIVQIVGYSYITINGVAKFTFAMERAQISLDVLLKQGKFITGLDVEATMDLIHDSCSALRSLKSVGIAHRDIKHMNILVFPSRNKKRRSPYLFKLCDLGGSKFETDNTGCTTLVGTPNCLHPKLAFELAKGPCHKWHLEKEYEGYECDSWSLACTLYFAACGRYPFPHGRDHALYYKAVEKLPKDAISADLVYGSAGFQYYRQVDNPLYPVWFRHCVSHIIRCLLHEPSLDSFIEMSDALYGSTQFDIVSLCQLDVFTYSDISSVPQFRNGYPSLHQALRLSPDIKLRLVSSNDVIVYANHPDDLKELKPNVSYLVFPCVETIEVKSKQWGTEVPAEGLENGKACDVRKTYLCKAYGAINDCEKMIRMKDETESILRQQLRKMNDHLINMIEGLQLPLRFCQYSKAHVDALIFTQEKERSFAMDGLDCAERSERELEKLLKILTDLREEVGSLVDLMGHVTITDDETLDLREELPRYLLSAVDEVKMTSGYVKQMVQSSYDRRKMLSDQLREERPSHSVQKPIVNILLETLGRVCSMWLNLNTVSKNTDESILQFEHTFQLLKMKTGALMNELPVSASEVARAQSFYAGPTQISTSAKEICKLANTLSQLLSSME